MPWTVAGSLNCRPSTTTTRGAWRPGRSLCEVGRPPCAGWCSSARGDPMQARWRPSRDGKGAQDRRRRGRRRGRFAGRRAGPTETPCRCRRSSTSRRDPAAKALPLSMPRMAGVNVSAMSTRRGRWAAARPKVVRKGICTSGQAASAMIREAGEHDAEPAVPRARPAASDGPGVAELAAGNG